MARYRLDGFPHYYGYENEKELRRGHVSHRYRNLALLTF
jgi:hypothetical protein